MTYTCRHLRVGHLPWTLQGYFGNISLFHALRTVKSYWLRLSRTLKLARKRTSKITLECPPNILTTKKSFNAEIQFLSDFGYLSGGRYYLAYLTEYFKSCVSRWNGLPMECYIGCSKRTSRLFSPFRGEQGIDTMERIDEFDKERSNTNRWYSIDWNDKRRQNDEKNKNMRYAHDKWS